MSREKDRIELLDTACSFNDIYRHVRQEGRILRSWPSARTISLELSGSIVACICELNPISLWRCCMLWQQSCRQP
jgi:hypothetical protein